MHFWFSPPSLDDLIRLLRAWRLWVLGALVGALLGGLLYFLAPPPYRARATVNVDFNLEQAWPKETDRQQFYYLEREVRKLEEIAWSDDVLSSVVASSGMVSLSELRNGVLQLSQPAEAGWHFYAEAQDPARAQAMASAWAQSFAAIVKQYVSEQEGLSSFIRLEVTQAAGLPVERAIPLSTYLLAGVISTWFLGFFILFLIVPQTKPEPAREPLL